MPVNHPPASITKSRYGWTIIVFLIVVLFVSGLIIWQLYETSPRVWCQIAEGTDNVRGACLSVALKLLEVKDHALIGLMSILAISSVSLAAVALGLKIKAGGPGNTSVEVGSEDTKIETDGTTLSIPTPPSDKDDK